MLSPIGVSELINPCTLTLKMVWYDLPLISMVPLPLKRTGDEFDSIISLLLTVNKQKMSDAPPGHHANLERKVHSDTAHDKNKTS